MHLSAAVPTLPMTLLDRPRNEYLHSPRRDTLPEGTQYSDNGCKPDAFGPGHPSCLNCPLAECKYEHDQAYFKNERNARIFELRKKGISVTELSRAFRISTRTVHRIIQRGGAA